ncbi:hypothetical protein JRQ81_006939 [Phrynocephalus forsythii]|uniref:C2H2-type domain-containing protein n=1 Tax=Phrynocephalus forsythii TaxID=171643 RepID=A0A9Q0XDX1_9SAUR|nr:hypothetical protein JRQ81_006939 [Phrynocephalus forsythii]
MAELFMECEEEELEPWQQKSKPIIVDDDDDDDEPIFVGEILSSKPTSTYILNRVNPGSSRIGLQNGAPKRGAVPVSPGFQSTTRPAASTLAVQPQPRVSSLSGSAQVLQRPLSGCPSPQEAAKSSAGASQSVGRPATAPALSRNLSIPVLAQSASRPVATVTAQPVMLNRGTLSNTSGLAFGLRQNAGGPPCQSGLAVNTTSLPKRPSTSDASSVSPKKAKAGEVGPESGSPGLLSAPSSNESSLLPKGASSSNLKNGAPFPQACPKCNIHFNLLEPLKNHIKYCCPEMMPASLGGPQLDRSGTPAKTAEAESGKLIMLVNDFYYGKHEGNVQQVRQEQKTHTTFKCASCMKVLKSNIRFMNHMKHHLELEKQNSESWESHTTCQHCYRQFPTPFQLQCHIESTHTPHESSTICKICELSFETEQVLLQHMKDNHKPGEMPYVCQVCSYRSSAFSDVEKHFRAVHENTKSLLCPFCLKVIKLGTTYMHHFMRHQKKGVHRCTKCRLQFLTCKEKMDHKSQHHRTFKKPPQLEGLPPGTKVTIRASVGSLPPAATAAPATCATPSAFTLSPAANMAKSLHKGNPGKGRSKSKMLSLQKKQSASGSSSSASSSSSSSSSAGCNKKNTKIANTALNNLRCPGIQKCIECYSDIRTFASHFPAYVRCSLCRYSTSCSKAYVNHMMSFHSARQNKRFWIFKTHSDDLSGMTVVCLNCDFLTNASEVDQMAAHLDDNDTHTCQIVMEHVPLATLAAAAAAADDDDDLTAQSSGVLLNQESDGKSQKHSRPSSPEEQKDKSACRSPQMELAGEAASVDSPGKQSGEAALGIGSEAPKPRGEGSPSAPGPPPLGAEEPEGSVEEGEAGHLGLPPSEGPSLPKDHEGPSPALGEVSGAGPQGCSEEGREADELGRNPEDGFPAAEGGGSPPLSQGEEPAAALEPPPGSEGSVGGGSAEGLVCQGKAGLFDTECEETLSPGDATCSGPSAHSRDPQCAPKEGDAGDPADQGLGFPAAKCEETASLTVPSDLSCPGPPSCSDDQVASVHDEVAGCQTDQGGGGGGGDCLGTESTEEAPPSSVPERSSSPGHSPGSGGPVTPTEGEEGNLANRGDSFLAAEGGEAPSLSAPETPSGLVPSSGSADPADVAGGGGGGGGGGGSEEAMECPAEEAPLAAGGEETPAGPSQAEVSLSGAQEPPKEPWKETAPDQLGEEPAAACEGSPSAPLAGKEPPSLGLQAALAESPSGEKATLVEGPGGGGGEGEEPSVPGGDEEAPGREAQEAASEAQAGGSPSDEAELVDVLVVNTEVTSDEDVIFEQFLSRNAEPTSANSDTSEPGSAHLEPLTPSEVLEHEATEILQKGAAGPSGAGAGAEGEGGAEEEEEEAEAEAGSPLREGSPTPEAASEGPPEGSDEAS